MTPAMQRTLIHPTMAKQLPNIKTARLSGCGEYLWYPSHDEIDYETGEVFRTEGPPPIRLADHDGLLEAWRKLTGA